MSDHPAPEPDGAISDLEIYKAQSARFINLNDTLYKAPPIFSTVIGGLWYFAFQQLDRHRGLAALVLVFAASVGLAGGNALLQLRKAINGYLNRLNAFEREHRVSLKEAPEDEGGLLRHVPRISTVRGLMYLLYFAAGLSALGAIIVLSSCG
jgi:hypothetical protein